MIDLKTARDSLAVFFCARKTGPQNGPEESGNRQLDVPYVNAYDA